MVSCMLDYVQCDGCHENTQRKDMSALNGICDQCFTRLTAPCADCGTLLVTGSMYYDGILTARYYNDHEHRRPLCNDCFCTRDGYVSWSPTPLNTSFATYRRIRSKRKYGIEIETASCTGYEDLRNQTHFGCKGDASICGKEFPSPVLYGDEGFRELAEFLAFARERDWTVDRDCGCHTHYDMRNETDQELYHIAYAYAKTYTFWSRCVGPRRRRNTYCHGPRYMSNDVRRHCSCGTAFTHFANGQQRYDYVNLSAYNRFKTFEVRLLEGTLSLRVICNWVTIHARFMDYVKGLSFDEIDTLLGGDAAIECILSAIVKIVDDSNLIDWLARRLTRIYRREDQNTRYPGAAFGGALEALGHPVMSLVTPPSEELPNQNPEPHPTPLGSFSCDRAGLWRDNAPQNSSEPGEGVSLRDYARRRLVGQPNRVAQRASYYDGEPGYEPSPLTH